MILEYHRPQTLTEALSLISRADPPTRPLGGGTRLNQPSAEDFAVVDLQALGLNRIEQNGNTLSVGASVTLQALLDYFRNAASSGTRLMPSMEKAILQETTTNLRQVATTAGRLAGGGGLSTFTTALLALDAGLRLAPGDEEAALGDILAIRQEKLDRRLILAVYLPLNARLAFASVARTPADRPLVCAAAAAWKSGRRRVVLGGYGTTPRLAFDGSEAEGADIAARSAFASAGDEWASAEYRAEMASLLTRRCLEALAADPI